jgi:hypothetical protein
MKASQRKFERQLRLTRSPCMGLQQLQDGKFENESKKKGDAKLYENG